MRAAVAGTADNFGQFAPPRTLNAQRSKGETYETAALPLSYVGAAEG